jgi:hypothetical protein
LSFLGGFSDRSQFSLQSIACTECPFPTKLTKKKKLKNNNKKEEKKNTELKKRLPHLVASVPQTS